MTIIIRRKDFREVFRPKARFDTWGTAFDRLTRWESLGLSEVVARYFGFISSGFRPSREMCNHDLVWTFFLYYFNISWGGFSSWIEVALVCPENFCCFLPYKRAFVEEITLKASSLRVKIMNVCKTNNRGKRLCLDRKFMERRNNIILCTAQWIGLSDSAAN